MCVSVCECVRVCVCECEKGGHLSLYILVCSRKEGELLVKPREAEIWFQFALPRPQPPPHPSPCALLSPFGFDRQAGGGGVGGSNRPHDWAVVGGGGAARV